jgi:hypothetical protein
VHVVAVKAPDIKSIDLVRMSHLGGQQAIKEPQDKSISVEIGKTQGPT